MSIVNLHTYINIVIYNHVCVILILFFCQDHILFNGIDSIDSLTYIYNNNNNYNLMYDVMCAHCSDAVNDLRSVIILKVYIEIKHFF